MGIYIGYERFCFPLPDGWGIYRALQMTTLMRQKHGSPLSLQASSLTSLLRERHGEAQARPGMLPAVSDNLAQKPFGLTYVLVALCGEGGLLPATSPFDFRSMAVEEKFAEVELRRGAGGRGEEDPDGISEGDYRYFCHYFEREKRSEASC